ncbi:hypothetical protein M434DRAFT_384012 [Hypoxylon sp. CO27-5]|nr:hypothetical protein M434DRAFT_384012 [Hypoxylon sp. CO27-5]
MSSGKGISVSIQPLQYADIPACARSTSSAFSVNPHTIIKQLGRVPYDMYTISRTGFLDTLHRKNYVYVKAVDNETGEIVGRADEKPAVEEREQGQRRGENGTKNGDKDGGEKRESSIDRLHALEDADMQYWLSNIVPADPPCIALIRYGNVIADDLGLSIWVHSSHLAYEAYKKFGFETVRELDIDLDKYAPRGPKDGEEAKGSGRWGSGGALYNYTGLSRTPVYVNWRNFSFSARP